MFHIFFFLFIFIISVFAKSNCVDHLGQADYLSSKSKECYKSVISRSPCRGVNDLKCICASELYRLDIFSCILEQDYMNGYYMALFFKKICKDNATDHNVPDACLETQKAPVPEKTLSLEEQNVTFDSSPSIEDLMFEVNKESEREHLEECIERGKCKGSFDSTCSITYILDRSQAATQHKTQTIKTTVTLTQSCGKPTHRPSRPSSSRKPTQTSGQKPGETTSLSNYASTDLGSFSSISNLVKLSIFVGSLMFLTIIL